MYPDENFIRGTVFLLYAGRVDRDHKPAVLHPIEVSLHPSLSGDRDGRIIAMLHDTFEDGLLTLNAIPHGLGIDTDGRVALSLIALTHNYHGTETYGEYIQRIKNDAMERRDLIAARVKLADLEVNMRRPGGSPSLLKRYIQAHEDLTKFINFF